MNVNHHEKFPRNFLFALLFLTIGLLLAGYLYFITQKNIYLNDKKRDLLTINILKVNQISSWLNERIGDARIIYSNKMTVQKFDIYLQSPDQKQLSESIISWLESRKKNYGYQSILLLNKRFNIQLSTKELFNSSLVFDTSLAYSAGRENKIKISSLYEYKNYVFIDIIIPLCLTETNPVVNGYLVLKINAHKSLYPLISFNPRKEISLETNLIERQNDSVVYLNRFHKQDAFIQFNRMALNDKEKLAVKAVMGDTGIVIGRDYSNNKVIGAVNIIPGTNLRLITKIEYAEVYSMVEKKMWIVIFSGCFIIFLTLLVFIVIWKDKLSSFYKKEYEFELENEKLRARFENINRYANDIILLLDEDYNIVDVNNKAIEVYGYTRSEFLKLKIMDIRVGFISLDYPITEESYEKNKIYVHEHRTKAGKIFPAEVSLSKIIIEGKTYYSEYIRDITDRRLSEERINYLSRLYSILSKVNQAILHNSGRDKLLQEICDIFIDIGEYKFIWVGFVDYAKKIVTPAFSKGENADYLKDIIVKTDDSARGRGPTGAAVRTGTVVVSNYIAGDSRMEAFKIQANKFGFLSSAAVPILFEGRVEAVLSVYSDKIHSFNEADIALLKEIGGDISFAFENIDIEEKKVLYQENLKKSEERFKDLFNNVPVGLYQATYDGKILLANKAYLNILGYDSIEELQNMHLNELYVDKDIRTKFIELLKKGEKIIGEEIQFYRKDKTVIWAKVDLILLPSGEEKISSVFEGTIVDITNKKSYEEKIINEKAFSDSLLNSLPELFLLVDESLNIVRYNSNVIKLFEYTSDEILNLNPLMLIAKEDRNLANEKLTNVFETGNVIVELNSISKSGLIRPLFLAGSQVVLYNKKYILILGVDISERKKLIKDLIQMKDRAEEANRIKSSFLANMSHEIRTPLIGIMGYAEILAAELKDEEHREMITTILSSSKRLKDTLNAILDLSRIESNIMELNISSIKINEIINRAVKLYSPVAKEKNLSIYFDDYDKDVLALVDETYYEQIVNNLIANAIKFTRNGFVKIALQKENGDINKFIKTSVIDTGIGIPKDIQHKIFEPFRQGSEGFARLYEGTGLGLTICKKLTEIMNGKIVVKSELGKGSIFEVYFPAA